VKKTRQIKTAAAKLQGFARRQLAGSIRDDAQNCQDTSENAGGWPWRK
jgi:hypothetical protein